MTPSRPAPGAAPPGRAPRAVGVVIPARDEADLLPGCLAALGRAISRLRTMAPDLDDVPAPMVAVIVVADACRDSTADLARGWGAHVIEGTFGVGAARAAGSLAVLRSFAGLDPAEVWLSHTDADSRVPRDWLVHQRAVARSGLDACWGTVRPRGLSVALRQEWRRRHHLGPGHPHVHGANLGVRASTYLEAGGFRATAAHEDVDLVRRVTANTPRWVATDLCPVSTSARREGRARGGFADYLLSLEAELA